MHKLYNILIFIAFITVGLWCFVFTFWALYMPKPTTINAISPVVMPLILKNVSSTISPLYHANVAHEPAKPRDFLISHEIHDLFPRDLPKQTVKPLESAKSQYPSNVVVPKIHFLTFATHGGRDDRYCRMLESAARQNVPLRILGWGEKWYGLSTKFEGTLSYLKTLPDNDLVIFHDGFDVLYLGEPQVDDIYQKYLKFGAGSIVFSAECGCWPQIQRSVDTCLKDYPTAPTSYRFLNSGSWIGPVRQSVDMLSTIKAEYPNPSLFNSANDQELVSDAFMQHRFQISLDYYSTLFQSAHRTGPPLPVCDGFKDMQFDVVAKTWTNHAYFSKPILIHFNGGGKSHHLEAEGAMWYKDVDYNSALEKKAILSTNFNVRYGNEQVSLGQMCPGYLS